LVDLLAGLAGCLLGAAALGYAALAIGVSFLGHVPGGIHSDWTPSCCSQSWCAPSQVAWQEPKEPSASSNRGGC